ncbi:MAG: hypothetical protein V1738_06415 [Patescibacteria group bacterium]
MTNKRTALPLYRQVLHDAWRLTLTHKHLWIFAFFATFIGFGGVSEILLGAYDRLTSALPTVVALNETPLLMLPGFTTIRAMINLSPYPALSLAFFVVLAIMLAAVFIYIVSLSIGALVYSIRQIERGGQPNFSEGLKAGANSIGQVLIVNLGAKVLVWLTFVVTGANLMHLLAQRSWISLFIFLCSFVLFTIIAVSISILTVYSTNSIVNGKLPIVPSIADGLKILKNNWLVSIEMVIILMVINVGIAVLALALAMIISVPLVFIFFVAAIIKSATMMTAVMTLTFIVLVSILFVAMSFLTTLQTSAWTLLWIELSGRNKYHPKILRLIDWFRERLTQ